MTEQKNLAGYTKSDYVRALRSAVDYICSYDSMVPVHIALMEVCNVIDTQEGLEHRAATTKGEMEHWLEGEEAVQRPNQHLDNTCSRCNYKGPEVKYTCDPFEDEVRNNKVLDFYCPECLRELADEI